MQLCAVRPIPRPLCSISQYGSRGISVEHPYRMSTDSEIRSSVGAYLELVRVFLTPTAVGDSFAGFSLATLLEPELAAPQRDLLPLACVCSVLAYWLGMASNDWFDFERDRSRALAKPLASGRISRRAGGVFCFVLGLGVIACGTALEILPLVIALLLLILAYNGGGKAIPSGRPPPASSAWRSVEA